jgi:hypothetical protein
MTIPVFAQLAADDAARQLSGAMSSTMMLFILAVVVLMIAATWRVYERAGEPGWAVLVPIFNIYILCKVARMSPWWMLAVIIPIVNIIFAFATSFGVAKRFGKGAGYGLGLALLPFIFWPLLAWGDAQPVAQTA